MLRSRLFPIAGREGGIRRQLGQQLRQQARRELLFKWGFPPWLINYAIGKSHNWTAIIRHLFAGEATEITGNAQYQIPQTLQESMLKKLAALAITEADNTKDARQLRHSLQLDGFDVSDGKVVPLDGPIAITEERSRLLTNLAASTYPRKDVIARHLTDAEDLYSTGKMHPAMGQARSAFEAAVEDSVSLVEQKTRLRAGGGLKNQIQFLSKQAFISADEEQAFLSAWGFLSAGAHPGLPPEEAGRVGLILALEFTHVLLVKAKNIL